MADQNEAAFEMLELRLKLLEDRIFDQNKTKASQALNLVDELLQVESKLKEVTAGKERFNHCHQRLMSMSKWLCPDYIDSVTASPSSLVEEVLANEEDIRLQAQQLDGIARLEHVIDSPQIRDCQSLRPQLDKIQLVIIDQKEEADKLNEETRNLLLDYNKQIADIKLKLANWDQRLRRAEAEKKQKRRGALEFD